MFGDLAESSEAWPQAEEACGVITSSPSRSSRASVATAIDKKLNSGKRKVRFVPLSKCGDDTCKHREKDDANKDSAGRVSNPGQSGQGLAKAISLLEVSGPKGVNTLSEGEWKPFKAVMDSGAADSVLPVDVATHVPLMATEASRRGQVFATADGGILPNTGERVVPMVTQDGTQMCARYQVAGVTKALNAVSKICDLGNIVVFESNGGYILNQSTGLKTWFNREQDVYTLSTWVWTGSSTPSFGRPE